MQSKCKWRILCSMLALAPMGLFSCAGTLRIPPGRASISDDGVFIEFADTLIDISEGRIFIELPGVRVDVDREGFAG